MNKIAKRLSGLCIVILLVMGITGVYKEIRVSQAVNLEKMEKQNETILQGMAITKLKVSNLNTMPLMIESYKDLNLKMTFDHVTLDHGSMIEKYLINSEVLPDFIVGDGLEQVDMDQLINQNIIVPLNDWIKSYAPHIQELIETDSYFREMITHQDGNIYTLPNYWNRRKFSVNQYLFVNKEWLDELGLSEPTTTQDFYEMLKAFKTKDPNGNKRADEIPFTFVSEGKYKGERMMLGSWGIPYTENYLMMKEGNILFGPMQEGYKEGIAYLSQLYQEKLIDPQIFTRSYASYYDMKKEEETELGAFIAYTADDIVGDEKAFRYKAILPLKGNEEVPVWMNLNADNIYKNRFAITVKNQHPEKTMEWIDNYYNQEKAFFYYYGEVGKTLIKEGEGYSLTVEEGEESLWTSMLKNAPAHQMPGYISEEVYGNLMYNPNQGYFERHNEMYASYFYSDELCLKYATKEELEKLQAIRKELDKYILNMEIRFISGERDINKEWVSFKAALKGMGAEKYINLYKTINERCKEANEHRH